MSDLLSQLDALLGVNFFSGEGAQADEQSSGPESAQRVLAVTIHRAKGLPGDRGATTAAVVVGDKAYYSMEQVGADTGGHWTVFTPEIIPRCLPR